MKEKVQSVVIAVLLMFFVGSFFTSSDDTTDTKSAVQPSSFVNLDETPLEQTTTGADAVIQEIKFVEESEALDFEIKYEYSDDYKKGTTHTTREGSRGEIKKVYRLNEGNKELVSEEVVRTSTPKIITYGTYAEPVASTSSTCDPNYTPCIQNVTYDLDCGDIGIRVRVVGSDRHRFDGDGDGLGCESY